MTLMVTLTIRRRIWKSIKASVHFICLVWFISFCNKNIVSGCDRRRDRRRMAGLYEMKCFLLTIHLVQMDKACVMRYRRLSYTPTRWSIWMFLSFEITHKIHFDSFSGQSNFLDNFAALKLLRRLFFSIFQLRKIHSFEWPAQICHHHSHNWIAAKRSSLSNNSIVFFCEKKETVLVGPLHLMSFLKLSTRRSIQLVGF